MGRSMGSVKSGFCVIPPGVISSMGLPNPSVKRTYCASSGWAQRRG